MKSLCFNTTSHQYLMWANRTDPAAGRLMIGRLFQKILNARMVLNTRESRLNTLWWNWSRSVAGVETEPAAAVWVCLFQRRSADDLYLLWRFWTQNQDPEQHDVWTHSRVRLCHILHFLYFRRQRWLINFCERVAVFVCWLPFSCVSANMFVKPMKRLTNIRSWNHKNHKRCRAK